MSTNIIVVQGVVKPDGTLELEGKVPLPAGKVQVTVQPLPELPQDDPFWQMMQEIWEARRKAGLVPRSVEEVEAERRALRDEWETRLEEIARLQEEGRTPRQQGGQAERGNE